MSHTATAVKAAPSSDLSARQEATLWAFADVVFVAVLLLLSATFLSVDSGSFLTATLIAPFIGWVVGNLAAFAIPRSIQTPSWVVAAAGVVLVVMCAVVFQSGTAVIATGRGLAGLVIGVTTGFLFLRAATARRRSRTA